MKSIFRFIDVGGGVFSESATEVHRGPQKFTTARFYSQRRRVKRRQDRDWILKCRGLFFFLPIVSF